MSAGDLISWLCDSSGFTPRTACGTAWTPGLVAVHEFCELAIFFAYLVIPPLAWIRFQQGYFSGTGLRGLRVFLAFLGLFVASCGATHLMGRLMFVWPAYRLDAVVLATCAIASWGTIWILATMRRPQ